MTIGSATLVEALGWAATATFIASYLFSRTEQLVRAQIAGALLWAIYGVLLHATPVVVANVLVVCAAAWKARRPGAARARAGPDRPPGLRPSPSGDTAPST